MSYSHFIITLFNINIIDEEWIDYRLQLFRRFTIPSVIHQTNQDFLWLILVDSRTPTHLVEQMYRYLHFRTNVVVAHVDLPKGMKITRYQQLCPIGRQYILDFVKFSKTHQLITTGLDNDDALSHNYVDEVHKFVESSPKVAHKRYILDSVFQYIVDTDFAHVVKRNMYERLCDGIEMASTSVTFVEPNISNACTVYKDTHSYICKSAHLRFIIPMRNLHLLHGQNTTEVDFEGKYSEDKLEKRGWRSEFLSYFPHIQSN